GAQIGGSNYDNRFLFTGREFMGVWYEYRARMYHPTLGRFTSEDPKGFDAGDYNLYRYCHNDPLDMTDPMGLEVGFWESLIPVWGSAHMAYDAYHEGHYGLAAFHAAMAATDVSGVKALGSTAVKAGLRGIAVNTGERLAAEKALVKSAESTAAKGGRLGGELHRATVAQRANELESQGHTITAGGGRLPERSVVTPEGTRRFPDISTRGPGGTPYYENIGRSTKPGEPIARERRALEDISRATGTKTGYRPYDRLRYESPLVRP